MYSLAEPRLLHAFYTEAVAPRRMKVHERARTLHYTITSQVTTALLRMSLRPMDKFLVRRPPGLPDLFLHPCRRVTQQYYVISDCLCNGKVGVPDTYTQDIHQRVIQQYFDSTIHGVPEKNSNVGSTALLHDEFLDSFLVNQSLHYKYNTLHCNLFSI